MKRSYPLLLLALLLGFASTSVFAQSEEIASTRKVTNKVVPMYPSLARSMNLSGRVKLEAVVLANGTVKSVQVKGGNPLLAQSAQSAIRAWKWEKAEHDTTELVEFNFNPN
jgi:TonB family protein